MIKRFAGQLTILAMLLSGATIVLAQGDGSSDDERWLHRGHGMRHEGMRNRMGDPGRMLELMTEHLDLDELQSQILSNIMNAAKPEFQALREGLRENHEAMRSLDAEDPDYGTKLDALAAANAEHAAQMTLLHGRVRAEVNAVLTPEQQQLMEARRESMRGHRRHRGGDEATG